MKDRERERDLRREEFFRLSGLSGNRIAPHGVPKTLEAAQAGINSRQHRLRYLGIPYE